jgi:alpha-pyrone synthase
LRDEYAGIVDVDAGLLAGHFGGHFVQGNCRLTFAYINRIATAVPPHDVHEAFIRFAEQQVASDRHRAMLFRRMVQKSGIEHRFSGFAPAADPNGAAIDADGFYVKGHFPDTAARMRRFEAQAPLLAAEAVERLQLGSERAKISHLLITCCTGFSAPGLDFELIERCGLPPTVERTMIGFMGCYAAINALKLARHIVRSDPAARVLVVNIELCTLHLQETGDLEQMLSFLLFGDGCAACLITADPPGARLESFRSVLVPDSRDLITWHIGESGFLMTLSGQVPGAIEKALRAEIADVLAGSPASIDLWAVHPGGHSVLNAVENALELAPAALSASREVLRRYGNMSSATVMFVLAALLRSPVNGASGFAMSFGPGLVAETMLFRPIGYPAPASVRAKELCAVEVSGA